MQREPANTTCVVVGITGGSGSGKTTFASRLLDRFGSDAALLSHDDYYWHLPHMTAQEAAAYDFDSPDALETSLLEEHIRLLKQGKAIDVPSYDFATYTRTEAARHIEPVPVVVVEGMLLGCSPSLLELMNLTVFIDSDQVESALRRIVRDCRERGADLERAVNMYLSTCRPAYKRLVEPSKKKADIVIDDALSDAALDAVAERILHERTALMKNKSALADEREAPLQSALTSR